MKPKRIILVRHGESTANANPALRSEIPDYAADLTDRGKTQAEKAGHRIAELIGDEAVYAYISPYARTRQTYSGITSVIGDRLQNAIEDPRIREQDWGHLRHPDEGEEIDRARDEFGFFYYRIEDGESCADVFDRVSTFLETMYRDFRSDTYPDNCLIVTHGLTLRIFLMRWLHWTVEAFEAVKNPRNGEVLVMERGADDKYCLTTELRYR